MKQLIAQHRQLEADGRRMRLLLLRPRHSAGKLPGVLWMHGGGYFLGGTAMVPFGRAADLAREIGAVIVAPAYRLAGEAPYPAALEDCYQALRYMTEHADALGIDTERLIVGGESAGGGLAAALCMYVRDHSRIPIRLQLPLYPMLDCEDTESSRDNHAFPWNTKRNHYGWKKYLAALDRSAPVPAYASPARQTDYRGLPPAYTFVCDGEPFYSETLAYVRHLRAAGVPADVDVYHAQTHAFDLLCPWLPISKAAKAALPLRVRALLAEPPECGDQGCL